MRRLLLLSVCLPALLLADEAAKRTKIDQLMGLMNSEALSRQMLDQARQNIMGQLNRPNTPPEMQAIEQEYSEKVLAIIAKSLDWSILKPKMAAIYDETFSESEIDGILTFYQSAAGRAFVLKMPELMNRSMKMSQDLIEANAPQIRKLTDEMVQKLKAQAAQQP